MAYFLLGWGPSTPSEWVAEKLQGHWLIQTASPKIHEDLHKWQMPSSVGNLGALWFANSQSPGYDLGNTWDYIVDQ